ncbi:peptidylprolyl isomerase [Stieleria marina]|uniref:peptidylprolyl isomerase n=1 Tax=Stieleria marina TaxID=1930275 RepID=A0A517NWL6_9BACT|nr:putative parvulin-type peptidyl-prolyl cis-trans isomerase precursor [Planctomycetes bacterium K23_9]
MPLQPARLMPTLALLKRFVVLPLVIATVFSLIGSSWLCSHATAQDQSNSVVAVVNAEPITRKALSDASLMRYGVDVLDNMINRHLILQACQKNGIEVTNDEVRGEIERLAAKFGLNVQSYMQLLEEERDITPAQYSREIVWPMLALRKLVAGQVEPTQAEFNQAYLSQFGEAVKCRVIVVPNKDTAESLRAQAAANPDEFSGLAKKYSKDEATASVGGLMAPIRRHTGDPALENAVFELQDKEVSPVITMGDQFLVLQAVRRIPASTPPPTALPAIKEQIKDRIRDQKMRGAASRLFAQLQKDAKVTKVLGDEKLQAQYPGVAAVINGQQVTLSAVGAECVKRHGVDVLQGEINRKLLTQAMRKSNIKVTREDITAEISRAAKSMGIVNGDGSADLVSWMQNVTSDGNTTAEIYETDSVWPSVALKKLVEDEITISKDDLQRGYESSYGPRVEILACVLADQRTAQKVWEMARDNPTEEFFGQLAEQYSIEPVSSSNRGKVPPVRKFGGQPAIEREVFGLNAGDLSGIVATGDKYIVMRCQGRTEPVVKDMAAVQSELVRDLREKKLSLAMAEKFDSLKARAEIDNFLEAAKNLQPEATPRVAQAGDSRQQRK